AVRVDVAEDALPVGEPAPRVVVGDAGERLEALGQPVREKSGARLEVGRTRREVGEAGEAGHADIPTRAGPAPPGQPALGLRDVGAASTESAENVAEVAERLGANPLLLVTAGNGVSSESAIGGRWDA